MFADELGLQESPRLHKEPPETKKPQTQPQIKTILANKKHYTKRKTQTDLAALAGACLK